MARGDGFLKVFFGSVAASFTIAVFLAILTLYTSMSKNCPIWFNKGSCDPPSSKSDDIKFDRNMSVLKFWSSWIVLIPMISALISSIGYARA